VAPLRLEARGLRKAFGERAALRGVDLQAGKGEVVVVVGPSGAGKSTLLRILALLLSPDAGEVRLNGRPVGVRDAEARKRIAWVGQKPAVFRQSAWDNVALGLRAAETSEARVDGRVRAAMERMGLWALRSQPARALSGGEQQRVAFARAMVLLPELLLLDEFTANLDPANVRLLEREVRRLADEGTAVVAASHDLPQARRIADHVALVLDGRLVEAAPAKQFFEAPATAHARAFLDAGR
jgi:tungstate transport system ATP-binding protein